MNTKTIMLSGAITGNPTFRSQFAEAERLLNKDPDVEWIILSPTMLPQEGFSWEQYMQITRGMVRACQTVFMLPNWRTSRGALEEHKLASYLGKEIIYQEDYIRELGDKLAERG